MLQSSWWNLNQGLGGGPAEGQKKSDFASSYSLVLHCSDTRSLDKYLAHISMDTLDQWSLMCPKRLQVQASSSDGSGTRVHDVFELL